MNRRTKKTRAGIDRIIDSSSRLDAESRKCLKLDFAIPVDTGVVFIYIYIIGSPDTMQLRAAGSRILDRSLPSFVLVVVQSGAGRGPPRKKDPWRLRF